MKNCHHNTTDGAWKKFRKGVNSFWKIGKNSKNKREPAFDGNFPSTTFTTNYRGVPPSENTLLRSDPAPSCFKEIKHFSKSTQRNNVRDDLGGIHEETNMAEKRSKENEIKNQEIRKSFENNNKNLRIEQAIYNASNFGLNVTENSQILPSFQESVFNRSQDTTDSPQPTPHPASELNTSTSKTSSSLLTINSNAEFETIRKTMIKNALDWMKSMVPHVHPMKTDMASLLEFTVYYSLILILKCRILG